MLPAGASAMQECERLREWLEAGLDRVTGGDTSLEGILAGAARLAAEALERLRSTPEGCSAESHAYVYRDPVLPQLYLRVSVYAAREEGGPEAGVCAAYVLSLDGLYEAMTRYAIDHGDDAGAARIIASLLGEASKVLRILADHDGVEDATLYFDPFGDMIEAVLERCEDAGREPGEAALRLAEWVRRVARGFPWWRASGVYRW